MLFSCILSDSPDLVTHIEGVEAAGNTCSNSFENYQVTSQSYTTEWKPNKAGTSGYSQSSLCIITEQAQLPANCFQAF